ISTAPNNKHILLGWSDGGGEFDFLFDAGELHDGEWLDGDTQPDWWMDGPPPPPKKASRLTARDRLRDRGRT
ncbi:MAG TPA: hypothetical protein VF442_12145, partial [Sphingobium sp.]